MNTHSTAKKPKKDFWKHIAIVALLALELFPFYMMLQISFKDNKSFVQNTWLPSLPTEWIWKNYWDAMQLLLPYISNSMVVSVSATLGTLFFALLGAYFFARYKMPFSGVIWSGYLILMLLPGVANIVPLFALLKSMNLLNTLLALIILGAAGGQVFCIYVLRNFIEEIPKDLFEAAEMDGASHFNQLWNIVVPMSGPILGTLAILQFLGNWNEFLMPLILLRDPQLFTIGVGLIYLDGEYVKDWGNIMAAFTVASIPLVVIFLFTMRLFVQGLSSGAVKG
jgi:ABC-type glycerol-3-phosphate transport system permease component